MNLSRSDKLLLLAADRLRLENEFDDAVMNNDGEEMCVIAEQLRQVNQRLTILRCDA